jgi:microcystin-dependent protein
MPNHNHTMRFSEFEGDTRQPNSTRFLVGEGTTIYTTPPANLVPMGEQSLPDAGGSQAHNNMQPYLAINFYIALVGLYPSRS